MHRALFERQEKWADAESPDAALGEIAASVGLDAVRFADCLGGRHALEHVLADVHDASRVTRSTPTFVPLRDDDC